MRFPSLRLVIVVRGSSEPRSRILLVTLGTYHTKLCHAEASALVSSTLSVEHGQHDNETGIPSLVRHTTQPESRLHSQQETALYDPDSLFDHGKLGILGPILFCRNCFPMYVP